jgi:hypothetical protein
VAKQSRRSHMLSGSLLLAAALSLAAATEAADRVVSVDCSDDLDVVINADPADIATAFQLGSCTYTVDEVALLRAGDELHGVVGTTRDVGPAIVPAPASRIVGENVQNLLRLDGSNIAITCVDMSGARLGYNSAGRPQAGTGSAIAAGKADGTLLVQYCRIHDNEGAGITNMVGRVLDSEFFGNTTNPDARGFIGAAVKGVREYEAGRNFIHDNLANGLWCDEGCSADPLRPLGAWVHDNVIVDNRRWGDRYEFSPHEPADGKPRYVSEGNHIAGNGAEGCRGGSSMHDAQNGTFRDNVYGPQTVAGVSYGNNCGSRAIAFTDSGRADRTDLEDGKALHNTLNGEHITGCDRPDTTSERPVGSGEPEIICAGNR